VDVNVGVGVDVGVGVGVGVGVHVLICANVCILTDAEARNNSWLSGVMKPTFLSPLLASLYQFFLCSWHR